MLFTPDEQEKTVKIPIQVRAGQIQFYFDGPLPALKEGIIGDLVAPYYAVPTRKARKLFSEERTIPLFNEGNDAVCPASSRGFGRAAVCQPPSPAVRQRYSVLCSTRSRNRRSDPRSVIRYGARLCDNRTSGCSLSAIARYQSAYSQRNRVQASDPVGDGLVSSLARPGGNITELTLRFPELDRKRLELLREAFPKVAR